MLAVKDAEKKYDLSSLRICASAGEALPKNIYFEWKQRFGQDILDGIGSTELMHIFISNRPGDAKPGSSGKIVPGYTAKIVDENGNEVPDGDLGNLLVRGESMAAFYYRQHDKSKASMLGEWFNTGDKYYRDAEGYYYYCGRGDDMLKVGGIWVSPIEIEDTLMSHPAVLETAVVGRNDENGLIKPKAYIVLKSGFQPSDELAKEIQAYVKKSIASYKYPRWIEFVKTSRRLPPAKSSVINCAHKFPGKINLKKESFFEGFLFYFRESCIKTIILTLTIVFVCEYTYIRCNFCVF